MMGDEGRKLVAEALAPFRSELARFEAEVRRALTPVARRRPRRPGPDAASVVIDPRRPSTLGGGAAAAALEFDA